MKKSAQMWENLRDRLPPSRNLRGSTLIPPNCARFNLVMHGKTHVGYVVMPISDWKRLLEEMY